MGKTMSKNIWATAFVATCLTGCATAPSFPQKRPMTSEAVAMVAETPVVVEENNAGISKTWFMRDSSAAGAQYGLIGALTTAIMDAIINAGPSRWAQKGANEIVEFVDVSDLNASLVAAFQKQILNAGTEEISVSSVSSVQTMLTTNSSDDAIAVTVNYKMAEDATAILMVAEASYSNSDMNYTTPYSFEKSVPKSELSGPLYRNTFTYESDQFPDPELTEETRVLLVESIEESYMEADGQLPVDGDDDFKAYSKEIEDAQDDKLSNSEASIFLVREWLKDDAIALKDEIESANQFFAHYILTDMNSSVVPSMEGEDSLIATLDDGRVIRMVGAGVTSGTYVSSPGTVVAFPTYGNAFRISDRNEERLKMLRKEAKE